MGMVNPKISQMGAELLRRVAVRSYGRVWKPKIDQEEVARLAVVGVGPLGARAIQMLSRIQSDLSCHEVLFDPQSDELAEVTAVLDVVRTSDLLFIVTGFDDLQCKDVFSLVADSAKDAGIPIIGVVPDNQNYIGLLPLVTSMWPVSHRSFGGDLASATPSVEARDVWWAEYALRHVVCTLANILTHKGLIGIDYDDVISTLKSGTIGRLAVGVASEKLNIKSASVIALRRLKAQGSTISNATGVVSYLTGSATLLTTDEFDAASEIFNKSVVKGIEVIVGVQPEALGTNVVVTVMALFNH